MGKQTSDEVHKKTEHDTERHLKQVFQSETPAQHRNLNEHKGGVAPAVTVSRLVPTARLRGTVKADTGETSRLDKIARLMPSEMMNRPKNG